VVLDVRTREEFLRGAYAGALNIPVQELARRLEEVPRGVPLVVYCAAGVRSAAALKLLVASGFSDVTDARTLAALISGGP
jgi:phage shock protein E